MTPPLLHRLHSADTSDREIEANRDLLARLEQIFGLETHTPCELAIAAFLDFISKPENWSVPRCAGMSRLYETSLSRSTNFWCAYQHRHGRSHGETIARALSVTIDTSHLMWKHSLQIATRQCFRMGLIIQRFNCGSLA
jgi:hypothetical protein